jgi:asparagine synthase (glutamine-hydrolysing)
MCGIAGIFSSTVLDTQARSWVSNMASALSHRGPDDLGTWIDPERGIAFGHRRLAVIDLSEEGHQPMTSESGRYVINFNGEIYNYPAMKKQLEKFGHKFRGHSDTETILAAIEQWGFVKTLESLIGMFALAVWDRKEATLFLARDRMGEKPLYYGVHSETLVFGSELKSFASLPFWNPEINRDALTLLLRYGYIGAPHSIYKEIFKLKSGSYLALTRKDLKQLPESVPYWSPHQHVLEAIGARFQGSEEDALNHLENLLKQSIAGQMIADVPVGAFLSGGIDSSTIVALMQTQSSRPVKTFSIGFHEEIYNEAPYAAAVAKHLGTEHTELYLTPQDALDVIPKLPSLYDEPFADSSQIPTYLVSKMAREHVTVTLSGDGGDELFGGYDRYFWANQIIRKTGWMPGPVRKVGAAVITSMEPASWDRLFRRLPFLMRKERAHSSHGKRLYKLAEMLSRTDFRSLYQAMLSHWYDPASVVLGSHEPSTWQNDANSQIDLPDIFIQMMFLDALNYLPDDVLVKVDRASMAVSLESRVPFLDHRVVEFAWSLPTKMKIRRNKGKWILRKLLQRYIPDSFIDRPKQGFGVPIDSWISGPLRPWVEELLSETRLKREGFFDPEPIRARWQEHLTGRRHQHYALWDILMFQAWLEAQNRG